MLSYSKLLVPASGVIKRRQSQFDRTSFYIILSLTTHLSATITSHDYALLFSRCFAKKKYPLILYISTHGCCQESIPSLSLLQGADNVNVIDNSDPLVKYCPSL